MIQIYDFGRRYATHKNLTAANVVGDAIANNVDTISVISSGNYLGAILKEVEKAKCQKRFRVVNLVNSPRLSHCLEVVIENSLILRSQEEREAYVRSHLTDTGKVKDYTDFIGPKLEHASEAIVSENPDFISLGVGSGKLYAVLYREIKRHNAKTKLIGVLPIGENGIFTGDNLFERNGNLYYREFYPKSLADKLVCPYTSFKGELLQAAAEGHCLVEVDDDKFVQANRLAKGKGLRSEVSGSAGLCVFDKEFRDQLGISKDASILAINTGCGKDESAQVRSAIRLGFVKPLAIAAGILLAVTQGYPFAKTQYLEHKYQRMGMEALVQSAAHQLGEVVDVKNMSFADLEKYDLGSRKRIGGPHHYWL